jgi:hypothetical protein
LLFLAPDFSGRLKARKESKKPILKKRRKNFFDFGSRAGETSTAQTNKVFLLLFVHKK